MLSIFLSHSSLDKPFVRKLAKRLMREGLSVWLDEAELDIGDSLLQKLTKAIKQVDYVAAVISKGSVKSDWVQRELGLAMKREIRGKKVVVLPILVESCEIPGFLKDKVYADFTKGFEKEFAKLLRAFQPSRGQAPRPEPPMIINSDDPQKDRWGGQPELSGRRLSAQVTYTDEDWFQMNLLVSSTDGTELRSPVYFHLHDSYPRSVIKVSKIRNKKTAVLEDVDAEETYTLGAEVQDRRGNWIGLELDLAELDELEDYLP